MRICSYPKYNNINSSTTFKSNGRKLVNTTGQIIYKNTSCFFRDDLIWHNLADLIETKYKNTPKVNVYNFACSEGAEPFSLAMMLLEKFGKEKAGKFFPIIASDIDANILENPQKGIIRLSRTDLFNLEDNLGKNVSNYIQHDNNFIFSDFLEERLCTGHVKPVIKDAIIFKKADIKQEIKNIQKNNSIILCRNFWPYIKDSERCKLVSDLYNAMGENTICIIGEFDKKVAQPLFRNIGLITDEKYKLDNNYFSTVSPIWFFKKI